MIFDGVEYELKRGSDADRDGMFLEASIKHSNPLRIVAEIFYSDRTQELSISCHEPDLPLELIETLIREARICLPKVN